MSDHIPVKIPGRLAIACAAILHLAAIDWVLRDMLPLWPGCELWLGHYFVLFAGLGGSGFLVWCLLYLPLNKSGGVDYWSAAAAFIALLTPALTLIITTYVVMSSRGLVPHP